jgi:hypothetical protein
MSPVFIKMIHSKLSWCIVKLGDDFNWWIHEVSDDIHWETDGMGILDPNQVEHIVDLFVQMQAYGLRYEIVESAFLTFSIEKEMSKGMVKLVATEEEVMSSREKLFAMPNMVDDRDGPYVDFIDHIISVRVKMLNVNLDFKQPLSIEELEENIRDEQQREYMDGKKIHAFDEIVAILDYVPAGYVLDDDPDEQNLNEESDLPDFDGSDVEDLDVDMETGLHVGGSNSRKF